MSTDLHGPPGGPDDRAAGVTVAVRHTPRRRVLFYAAVFLSTLAVLAAFATFASRPEAYGTEPPTTTGALADRTFEAVSAEGVELPSGSAVSLTFDDDRVVATAGCNSLLGPATWDGQRLALDGPLASTQMACHGELEGVESWLAGLIESGPAATLDGTTLTVSSAAGALVLEEVGLAAG